MVRVAITGFGSYIPEHSVTTEELCEVFNKYVLDKTDSEEKKIQDIDLRSIKNITGIKSRYFIEKSGILNPQIMHPLIKKREESDLSLQAEIGLKASLNAIKNANKSIDNIGAVIVACTNSERSYPSIAIEIQNTLEIKGFAFDINMACSSAIFALQSATNIVINGQAKSVLVVVPEIISATADFRDRNSFFLFGDASTAFVVENIGNSNSSEAYEVISIKLHTNFSNNIRSNFGFLNRFDPDYDGNKYELFKYNGTVLFREMITFIPKYIKDHLSDNDLVADEIKLFWLHQANQKMNKAIANRIFDNDLSKVNLRFPSIIDEFGNTGAAGCILAFQKNKLKSNSDLGVMCAFGAGYSVASAIIRKI